jgi:hypothetical protein
MVDNGIGGAAAIQGEEVMGSIRLKPAPRRPAGPR